MERLPFPVIPLQRVGIEQLAALFREDQTALVSPKVDSLGESLLAEMFERAPVSIEILFGHDAEGADGGQRAAILAAQLVDTVAIDHKLALLAAREVEVVNQRVASVVIVSVPLVVHARWSSPRSGSPYSRGSLHRASDIGAPLRQWRWLGCP
ncbi:MAG: hypothetical protein ABR606_02815 [Vicinamibacterales bacterium]